MHIPVLTKEVIEGFNPQSNENYIDCTVGNGGHTISILENTAPNGKVLGIDWDSASLATAKEKLKEKGLLSRVTLVQGNYADLEEIVKENKFSNVSGILLDLGYSSNQIDETDRGFSFKGKGRLDMRYNSSNPQTSEKILNFESKKDLEQIFKEFGEEQFAKQIAEQIIETRKDKNITTTDQLVEIVMSATPTWYHKRRIHPATKVFQALRIAVNRELDNLTNVLPQTVSVVKSGGEIQVISFHSLEDRVVKNFAKDTEEIEIVTKKPITPAKKEVEQNPRSASSKLRTMKKK